MENKNIQYILIGSAALYGIYKFPSLILPLGFLGLMLFKNKSNLIHLPEHCPTCNKEKEKLDVSSLYPGLYYGDPLNKSEFNLKIN